MELERPDSWLRDVGQGKHQASHTSKEVLPADWIIPVLLPGVREHLTRIKTNVFKYHVCSRKSLSRWMCGIGRERMASKKIAETALEYAPNADIERFLFFMDKLYTSSMISTEAIGQVIK